MPTDHDTLCGGAPRSAALAVGLLFGSAFVGFPVVASGAVASADAAAASWMADGWLVVGVVAVLEAALVAALLVERRRLRRSAESLRESRERNSALLLAIPDLLFLVSEDGTCLDYHANDPSQLALPPEEFLGRTVRDLVPPNIAEAFDRAFASVRETVEPRTLAYTLDLGGRRHDYEARIVAAGDGRFFIHVRDVTDRNSAYESLRRLTDRLVRLQDEERKRVASELHDSIGQSLAIIRNRAIIGLRSPTDAERLADQMNEIAEAAAAAVDEVREIAHNLRPFELDRLGLRGAVRSMAHRVADASGIPVIVDLGPDEVALGPDDETSLYRIVQELLNNVVRHAHASEAHVSFPPSSEGLSIVVRDDGRGMPPDGEETVSVRRGFGLADITNRVRMLGGTVAIASETGRGTTVTVTVPAVRRDGDRADADRPRAESSVE